MDFEMYIFPQNELDNKIAHPDQKYIEALLNNDRALLDELYRKYSDKVKWMVLQNRGTEADAADIFQDALLCVYNRAKTKNFVLTCPLDAFLYLICKRKWLNELNKRKVFRTTFIDLDEFNHVNEDTILLSDELQVYQERKELVMEKFSGLADNIKELLRLSWSGRSMEEVADILHVTYGYARKKKCECMAKLISLVKQSPRFNSLQW
jgi:RNA polymerase sigma factor (sigma-70 family)